MPAEGGEKPLEKTENSHEGDRGGDRLKWCLKEYERTMNSQGASDEVTTKADEIEEHRAGAEGRNESTKSESENSSTDGSNLTQRNEVADKESEVVAGERPQRIEEEHQHISREPSPHPEAPLTERPNNLRQEEAWGEREAERGREAVGESTQTSGQQRGKSELTQHGEIPHAEQQHPNNVDKHGHEEMANSTKTRGQGDASSRTNADRPNPEKAVEEQATELNKIRVYDCKVARAGELVREWRTQLGLSQRELADKLGYVRGQIDFWEINATQIPLQDLQRLSRMVGKDLEQALRGVQSSEGQDIAIKWKEAVYGIDAFMESIQNPHATLNYNEARHTYYLQLNPMANVEFHSRDIMTTLLEKDGVQAIAELTASWGTKANIIKADIKRIGIKVGDKLNVNVLNVRGPEDPPWKQCIQVTPTATNGEMKIQLSQKLEELGFNVRDGNYAKMAIQLERGKILVTGRIEDGAIELSKNITNRLLTRGRNGEADTLRVRTDSVILSPEPFRERMGLRAKSGDRTTLKTEGEGFAIIHENRNYKIATIEQERIGGLQLYRYRTQQGEEFLHIPEQDKVVPPYETPWYALPLSTDIYLEKGYKHELLQAAIDKAGGKAALRRELEERGTELCKGYLRQHLRGLAEGVSADRLIPILTYLGRDLDEANSHITAIGHRKAIENPILPFKMNTMDGARLHSARFSDGSLSVYQGGRPLFEYTNNDAEQRNRIKESLTNVFGKANTPAGECDGDKVPRLRATTDIIGYVLRRSGAITGRVVDQNPDIPTFIREGPTEIKREWLRQAFGDEGSATLLFRRVTLSRAVDATHRLSNEQRNRLDALSEGWKNVSQKDIGRKPFTYCMFKGLPEDIQEALELEGPRLLESEAKILHDDFDIITGKYPIEIYRRKGGYGVTWNLQTASIGDSRKFYNEIGFPQKRKQETLRRMLRIEEANNH